MGTDPWDPLGQALAYPSSVKKQRGRWIGMWYAADGSRPSKVLVLVKDMTKSDARAVVNKIVTEVQTPSGTKLGSGRLVSS
jgi:hypothetical protein